MFITREILSSCTWQAFERLVCRLLTYEGFSGVRLVGQTADHGADVLAHKYNKRWLIQVKHWKNTVGSAVLTETLAAAQKYRAHIPVIVASNGFDSRALAHQRMLLARGTPLQLQDSENLIKRAESVKNTAPRVLLPRKYQEDAIQILTRTYLEKFSRRALIVMATGLGKTFTLYEAIRRIRATSHVKVLILAHTNELVYQLERALWPFIHPKDETIICNGEEQPAIEELARSPFVFACIDSIYSKIQSGASLPDFDMVVVDECHHAGSMMYAEVLKYLNAGHDGGPFLIGMTATPWRPDEKDLHAIFGEPLVCVDMVEGLKKGFLVNVDYRMYTDNIDWESLKRLNGRNFSPKQINRALFINEWDDSVVDELKKTWANQAAPRAIVFCGTIDHAITMRDRINVLNFCKASAIFSTMVSFERNKILCDFQDGLINVICAVDIFNEGVDVPDVNIIVFQRVTHSRRIFIQQLGRGLRLSQHFLIQG